MCIVEILHRAQIGQNVYTEYARTIYIYIYIYRQFSVFTTSVGLAALAPIILGECSALWGEREGVVWCISVP